MNILLVGVFSPSSTNTPMAAALEAIGHKVVRFPYRQVVARVGHGGLQTELYQSALHADAVVICKGCGAGLPPIQPETLASIRRRTVYWLPDSVEVQGPFTIDLARACDVACATSLVSCHAFQAAGHPRVNQIFEGFDPKVFKPRNLPKIFDVTFVGSLNEHRASLIDLLECRGIEVTTPVAWTDKLSRVYNRSKIVLNFVRGEIFSDRVIQGMASGTFVLTEACRDIHAAFVPTEDLAVWAVWHDLPNAVRYWLDHDEARTQVGVNADLSAQRFTWAKQMEKLILAIEGEQWADGAFMEEEAER